MGRDVASDIPDITPTAEDLSAESRLTCFPWIASLSTTARENSGKKKMCPISKCV